MCLIEEEQENLKVLGNCFFLELDDKAIPFSKCLLTCNHILRGIEVGKLIHLEYQSKIKIIKITSNRRAYTNKELDYTLIEIKPEDEIKQFFKINSKLNFELLHQEIFVLQYDKDRELGFSSGKILSIKKDIILHSCPTQPGSAGSPLILRSDELCVIGFHLGKYRNEKFNVANLITSIINDIKDKISTLILTDYREKYKNLEIIGNGTFGIVYKGKIDNNNLRALKVIDKFVMKERLKMNYNKEDIEEEFKKEIEDKLKIEVKLMKICMKDNINSIQFYEFYDIEKEYAIVMELCDDNLHNLLNKKERGFNCEEIIDIIKQLNNTFKIMSNNCIVHRDLKLENILVKYIDNKKSKFIVKLSDYGISRKMLSMSKKCSTYAGTIITMAPEILAGEEYDNKCDLWSLGVIIYQLFFKEYPYDDLTEVAIYNKIKKLGQSIIKKTKNEKLDNLIRKLLVENPLNRYGWEEYFNDPIFKDN